MFSLFGKQKATINSVRIFDCGWAKVANDKLKIQWINSEQTIALSINFFDLPPNIPTIKNIGTLRDFYRDSVSDIGGGLIEVDLFQKNKINICKTIVKIPQHPSGITYIASLTIPFENCSFVLKVQASEQEPTGMRETMVANKLLAAGTLKIDKGGYADWLSDPYDVDFKLGTLLNKSEKSNYDIDFPRNPLTLARQMIAQVQNSLQFGSELYKLSPFSK